MAPRALSRSLGRSPLGVAIVAWRVWQRLPPSARRRALLVARKHGIRARSEARTSRPPPTAPLRLESE